MEDTGDMQARHNYSSQVLAPINVMIRLEVLLGIRRCSVSLRATGRINVVLNAVYNRILIRTIVRRSTRRVMLVVNVAIFLVCVVLLMWSLERGTSDNQARVPASAVTGVENPLVVVLPSINRCIITVLLSLN